MRYEQVKFIDAAASSGKETSPSVVKNKEYTNHIITDLGDADQLAMFEEAYELYRQSFPKEELASRKSLEEGLSGKNPDRKVALLVTTDSNNNKVVGGLVVSLYETDRNLFGDKSLVPYDCVAAIGYAFVDDAHRRQKIGASLENAALQFAGQYSFKGRELVQKRDVLAVCDVEDLEVLVSKGYTLKELEELVDTAQMTFAERLRFWCEDRGYSTVQFPYILCANPEPGEELKPKDTLKLRAKGVRVENCRVTPQQIDTLSSAFLENIVLRWIYRVQNKETFNKLFAQLTGDPQIINMLTWSDRFPETEVMHPSMERQEIERAFILEKEMGLMAYMEQKRKNKLKLEPLTTENLDDALIVGKSIFSNIGDSSKELEQNYRNSLIPRDQWDNLGAREDLTPFQSIYCSPPDTLNYYVARLNGKIVGVTGLYEYKNKPDECWIGWFGIDPKHRGCGLGKELLSWTLEKARSMGKQTLWLWTSDHPDVSRASVMYSKAGFQKKALDPNMQIFGYNTFVFSKGL